MLSSSSLELELELELESDGGIVSNSSSFCGWKIQQTVVVVVCLLVTVV